MMLTITPWHQANFENVWMFYRYLSTFSLEKRHYIVGAENRFQPKFHDLKNLSASALLDIWKELEKKKNEPNSASKKCLLEAS
jgi:hypothetical protein